MSEAPTGSVMYAPGGHKGSPALGPGVGSLELPLTAHNAGIEGQLELYKAGIRGA